MVVEVWLQFPLKEDGSLGADIQYIQHEGSSIAKRQARWATSPLLLVLSPDNHYLLTADLGTDKVSTYLFDAIQNFSTVNPC